MREATAVTQIMDTSLALEHGYEIRMDQETVEDEGYNEGRSEPRTASISRDVSPMPRNVDFPKSASYTYLPNAKDSAYGSVGSLPNTIKGSLSEDDLVTPLDSADVSPPDSSGWTTPTESQREPTDVASALVVELQKSPKFRVSSRSMPTAEDDFDEEHVPKRYLTDSIGHPSTTIPPKARLHEASFARRLSRRISLVPSRSPSPTKRTLRVPLPEAQSNGSATPPFVIESSKKSVSKKRDGEKKPSEAVPAAGRPERKSTILRRRSTKSGGLKSGNLSSILPKSFSTDRLPSLAETQLADAPSPMPRIVSAERSTSFGSLALPRKKDDLWSVLRALEADYAKCVTHSSHCRTQLIRLAGSRPSQPHSRPTWFDHLCSRFYVSMPIIPQIGPCELRISTDVPMCSTSGGQVSLRCSMERTTNHSLAQIDLLFWMGCLALWNVQNGDSLLHRTVPWPAEMQSAPCNRANRPTLWPPWAAAS